MAENKEIVVSGIEMNTGMITYPDVSELVISSLKEKYRDVTDYKVACEGIKEIRPLRTAVEKRRLEWGRKVKELKDFADNKAKTLISLLLEVENPCKAIKAEVDDEKARVKAEAAKVEKERIEKIRVMLVYIKEAPLSVVGKDLQTIKKKYFEIQNIKFDSQEFWEEENRVRKDTNEALFLAVQEREELDAKNKQLAEDKAKLEEEKELREKEQAEQKAEQKRIDKIKNVISYIKYAPLSVVGADPQTIKDMHLKIQNIEFDFQEFEEEAAQAIFDTNESLFDVLQDLEKKKKENEVLAEKERKIKIAENKIKKDKLRIQLTAETKETAKKEVDEENNKADEAELKAIEEAKQEEALRPDKDKLQAFADEYLQKVMNDIPIMQSEETARVVLHVKKLIEEIQDYIWKELL